MRSKKSIHARENSEQFPNELITEILLRLPAKSIARCRCVSKLWASALGLPYFTELFLTRSSSRPQLLFTTKYKNKDEVFFYSSPQPQNPDEKSPHVAATYHMKIPYNFVFERFSPIGGLVYLRDHRILKGKKHKVSLICNPSTRQCLTLPKVKTRRRIGVVSYLGYDPIGKQYKVLSMTSLNYGGQDVVSEEHQVLTLGTGEPSWRSIKCFIPHSPEYDEICINGVLYYPAVHMSSMDTIIICFDVRSETFRFINVLESFTTPLGYPPLINYNGKLGLLMSEGSHRIKGNNRSIELRILEDIEKQEWSEHTYVLPALWQSVVGNTVLHFVGMIRTNEMVLASYYQTVPFYVFFYNTEKNTIIRVGIHGMEALGNETYTYLDHVENVKLLY